MDDETDSWLPDIADMLLDEVGTSQDPALLEAVKRLTEEAVNPPDVVQENWYDN